MTKSLHIPAKESTPAKQKIIVPWKVRGKRAIIGALVGGMLGGGYGASKNKLWAELLPSAHAAGLRAGENPKDAFNPADMTTSKGPEVPADSTLPNLDSLSNKNATQIGNDTSEAAQNTPTDADTNASEYTVPVGSDTSITSQTSPTPSDTGAGSSDSTGMASDTSGQVPSDSSDVATPADTARTAADSTAAITDTAKTALDTVKTPADTGAVKPGTGYANWDSTLAAAAGEASAQELHTVRITPYVEKGVIDGSTLSGWLCLYYNKIFPSQQLTDDNLYDANIQKALWAVSRDVADQSGIRDMNKVSPGQKLKIKYANVRRLSQLILLYKAQELVKDERKKIKEEKETPKDSTGISEAVTDKSRDTATKAAAPVDTATKAAPQYTVQKPVAPADSLGAGNDTTRKATAPVDTSGAKGATKATAPSDTLAVEGDETTKAEAHVKTGKHAPKHAKTGATPATAIESQGVVSESEIQHAKDSLNARAMADSLMLDSLNRVHIKAAADSAQHVVDLRASRAQKYQDFWNCVIIGAVAGAVIAALLPVNGQKKGEIEGQNNKKGESGAGPDPTMDPTLRNGSKRKEEEREKADKSAEEELAARPNGPVAVSESAKEPAAGNEEMKAAVLGAYKNDDVPMDFVSSQTPIELRLAVSEEQKTILNNARAKVAIGNTTGKTPQLTEDEQMVYAGYQGFKKMHSDNNFKMQEVEELSRNGDTAESIFENGSMSYGPHDTREENALSGDGLTEIGRLQRALKDNEVRMIKNIAPDMNSADIFEMVSKISNPLPYTGADEIRGMLRETEPARKESVAFTPKDSTNPAPGPIDIAAGPKMEFGKPRTLGAIM